MNIMKKAMIKFGISVVIWLLVFVQAGTLCNAVIKKEEVPCLVLIIPAIVIPLTILQFSIKVK